MPRAPVPLEGLLAEPPAHAAAEGAKTSTLQAEVAGETLPRGGNMALSLAQRKSIHKAVERANPDSLTTAEELHQFALHYNWDDGAGPLRKLIAHPKCDRATALCVYWLGEPDQWLNYANLAEAKKAGDVSIGVFELLLEIEARLARKSLKSTGIAFKPPKWKAPKRAKRELPKEVFETIEGRTVDEDDLYLMELRAPTTDEVAVLDRHLGAARKTLKNAGFSVDDTLSPDDTVAAISKWVQAARVAPKPPPAAQQRAVSFLFTHQLHRAFDGLWLTRMWNDNAELRLYSQDLAISVTPDRPVSKRFDASLDKYYSLEGLYRAFGKVAKRGNDYKKLLTPPESKHLYREPAGSWPVWGVQWKLPPEKRSDL